MRLRMIRAFAVSRPDIGVSETETAHRSCQRVYGCQTLVAARLHPVHPNSGWCRRDFSSPTTLAHLSE